MSTLCFSSGNKEILAKQKDQSLNNLLLSAASKASKYEVARLVNEGADPQSVDEFGATPLLVASLNGNLDVVKFLIRELKVNKNASTFENANAIFLASYGGHLEVIKYLLRININSNVPDINGLTPFLIACYKGHLEIVNYFVSLDKNVLRQKSLRGANPLIMASLGGHEEVIRYLVKQGLDVNYKDKYGFTPLILASASSDASVLSFLIQKKAKVDFQSQIGSNSLIEAVRAGKIENVKVLLDNNASANIGFFVDKSEKPLTALDLSRILKRKDIEKLLLSRKALSYDELDRVRELS